MSDIPTFQYVERVDETELRDRQLEEWLETRLKTRLPSKVLSTATIIAPSRGDIRFDTDTGNLLVYYGATTGWKQPWNVPWGVLARAEITAGQGSITTEADLTSLTVTWTGLANRLYRVDAEGFIFSTVAADNLNVKITDNSNTLKQLWQQPALVASASQKVCLSLEEAATGSTTRKLRAVRVAGTGTVTFNAGATFPAFLSVKDIGATGNAPAS